jgi:hypothetical protein
MGVLKFIYPATGEEVSTGVGVEAESFERLPSSVPLDCPHCQGPHALGSVKAWVEGEEDAD